ncbi:hypothetical protein GCM10009608_83400 [Pseudonocardia alaniniphila]
MPDDAVVDVDGAGGEADECGAVGRHDDGAALDEAGEGLDDESFCVGVEACGGFVEERDADALARAAGQPDPTVAEPGVEGDALAGLDGEVEVLPDEGGRG